MAESRYHFGDMKRNVLLLFPILLAGLASCSSQIDNPEKVALDFGTHIGMDAECLGNSHTTKIVAADLQGLVDRESNFILIAHASSRMDCTCYSDWHDTIFAPYVKRHNLLVYLIEMDEVSGEDKESYGLTLNSLHATLAIFKKGKVKYQKTTANESDPFVTDSHEFAAWMNYRIQMPRAFFVDKAQLDAKYNAYGEFTVYFSRNGCGDCSYFSDNYLREYLAQEGNFSPLYILDCDVEGICFVKGDDGVLYGPASERTWDSANEYQKQAYNMWNAFKQDYGMAESEDNPAGWSTGYVPTLFHINPTGNGKKKGSVIDGAMVIYNDSITDNAITSTYFTKERLELSCLSYLKDSKEIAEENKVLLGKSVPTIEGATGGLARRKATATYHDPIAKAFLDAFIKN